MNKSILLGISLLGLAFTGCQPPSQQQQFQRYPQPPRGNVYYYQYDQWTGPGWYYGIYFSDEGRYRNWNRRGYHGRSQWHQHHGQRGGHRGRR